MIIIRGLTFFSFNKLKQKLKCVIDDNKTKVIDLGGYAVIDVELPKRTILVCGEFESFITLINPERDLSCIIPRNSFEYIEMQ